MTHLLLSEIRASLCCKATRKKRPASRVFFFLPAFGRCCPSVSAHPANRIRCSSNIAIADHKPFLSRRGMASLQSNSIFSFKHHLTGEAWPVCRAILPLHSNTTCVACLAWSLYIVRTSTIAKNRRPGYSRFARLTTH